MKRDPTFEPWGEALRSLPRHRAGEGFTESVLERLDEQAAGPAPRRASPAARWLAAAAGLLGLLAAGAGLLSLDDGESSGVREAASLQALAAERARLEEEVRELRSLVREDAGEAAREESPVLYLGGTEDVDLVLDLGRLADERSSRRAVPAGYAGPERR